MDRDEKVEKLNQLVARLFGEEPSTMLGRGMPPFEIARPNIHDSKKEFLMELDSVKSVLTHLDAIIRVFFNEDNSVQLDKKEMMVRLRISVDAEALRTSKAREIDHPRELVFQNLAQTGFFAGSIMIISQMHDHYIERLQELERQEIQFWSVAHRPPNYYARAIAYRFARYFAKRTSARPTFGTSSDGPHPSTDFGRALEEVFEILEIKSNLRVAADWAIGQLVENDWKPRNALAGFFPETSHDVSFDSDLFEKISARVAQKGSGKKPLL
jgi:hypothetical protein